MLFSLLATASEVRSQQFSDSYAHQARKFFTDWRLLTREFSDPIILDNTSNDDGLQYAIKRINDQYYNVKPCKVKHYTGERATDSIVLDKPELESLMIELQRSAEVKWGHIYFPGAKVLSKDSLTASSGKPPLNSKGYWALAKPVFIRKGTFCLFYFEHWQNNTAETMLYVYTRGKGRWQYYGSLLHSPF